MKTLDILEETYTALSANKVRSGLTVLGIVIGISSVIIMVSIGQGAQNSIQSSIQSIGSNLIMIMPGAQKGPGFQVSSGRGSARTLTQADADAISSSATFAKAIAPEISGRYQITSKGKNTNTSVLGVTSEYLSVKNIEVNSGSFITDQNLRSLSKVAVLGPTARDDLFEEGVDAVGQTIRIKNIEFKIIGIKNKKSMTSLQQEITELLLERHHISDPQLADFSVLNQEDIVAAASSVTSTFTMLLAAVAGISLVVGGIGIMNMMLTTVTERTREIGLRKAIGAKRSEINLQFLIEAIVLTCVGGLVGIVLGWAVSFGITYLGILQTSVSFSSVLLAFGVSAVIGIVFGYFPARRAAALNPIDALRYE